jgi:hypothetical protein
MDHQRAEMALEFVRDRVKRRLRQRLDIGERGRAAPDP